MLIVMMVGGDTMIVLISMDGDNRVNIIFINILKIGFKQDQTNINIFTAEFGMTV